MSHPTTPPPGSPRPAAPLSANSFSPSLSIPIIVHDTITGASPPSSPGSPTSSKSKRGSYLAHPLSQVAEKLKRNGAVHLGESASVVVLPSRHTHSSNNTQGYNATSNNGRRGLEELAERLMAGVSSARDQAVVFRGEKGSGKSLARGAFLTHLIELSKTPKKKSRVLSGAMKAETVFESFAHAYSGDGSSSNASRVVRYTEYQYDAGGKMVGMKLLDCLFDRHRVAAGAVPGERNFNVFYQLLAGLSGEDRTRLSLDETKRYRYLGGATASGSLLGRAKSISRSNSTKATDGAPLSRTRSLKRALSLRRSNTLDSYAAAPLDPIHIPSAADADSYAVLCDHLKSLGIGRRAQSHIKVILAAILHLGEITFAAHASDTNEACVVRNTAALETTADLLGVLPENLENTLVYRTRMSVSSSKKGKKSGGALFSEMLDVPGAESQRDEMARCLYEGLFGWLVGHLNARLCKDDQDVTCVVAVLDVPGCVTHTTFTNNGEEDGATPLGLADLMINWANERLERLAQHAYYEVMQKSLTADGVPWPDIQLPQPDNHGITVLLEGKSKKTDRAGALDGVFPILEEESLKKPTAGKPASENLASVFTTYLSASPHYTPSRSSTPGTTTNPLFTIEQHTGHRATYSTADFVRDNTHSIPSEFIALFCGVRSEAAGGTVVPPSTLAFAAHLFSAKSGVETEGTSEQVVSAHRGHKLDRKPSMAKLASGAFVGDDSGEEKQNKTVVARALAKLGEVFDCVATMQTINVYCIKPNDQITDSNGAFESVIVTRQLNEFGIPYLSRLRSLFNVVPSGMPYKEFAEKYSGILAKRNSTILPPSPSSTPRSATERVLRSLGWVLEGSPDVVLGRTKVFLTWEKWRALDRKTEDAPLAAVYSATNHRASMHSLAGGGSSRESVQSYGSETQLAGARRRSRRYSVAGETDDGYSDAESCYGSEFSYAPHATMGSAHKRMSRASGRRSRALGDVELGSIRMDEVPPVPLHPLNPPTAASPPQQPTTTTRKVWLAMTYCLTFYIPTLCLTYVGKMRTPEIRTAWREKVALCTLIFLVSASILFFIVGLSWIVCPPAKIKSQSEIRNLASSRYVSAYGKYYDVSELTTWHTRNFPQGSVGQIKEYDLAQYYGTDVSNLFLRAADWERYCPTAGVPPPGWDNVGFNGPWEKRPTVRTALHQGKEVRGGRRPYVEYMNQYARGRVGWSEEWLRRNRRDGKIYTTIFSNVYYLNSYFDISPPPFPARATEILSASSSGTLSLTPQWAAYRLTNPTEADAVLRCLNAMFYIGTIDTRATAACKFTNYILVTASVVLCAVIAVKFLAALQFASKGELSELQDRFVMCLVTAYTESEAELRKTIDSVAATTYDDRRKLLVVVCDGMVMGAGNALPTPEIVLDILGVDPYVDPPPVAYHALGDDGARRYNRAKVYTGLYYTRGRAVPFVVVVKVGAEWERVRPGNRGKRDSQLVVMGFLNRVLKSEGRSEVGQHEVVDGDANSATTATVVEDVVGDARQKTSGSLNRPTTTSDGGVLMDPLQIELQWSIERIIGVPASMYEFVLMVDADTEVSAGSLNSLVRSMVDDAYLMGVCGETRLANEKQSWTTMIQVYEYFISHYLSKAFESLFGTVTCLPGCFCMWRVKRCVRVPVPTTATTTTTRLPAAAYATTTIPLLAHDNIIALYADTNVSTLHMKNLLTLGEDRYLTTIMLKTFPSYRTGFTGSATCHTAAPATFSVLLSQRRRWINSTVHNLAELLRLRDLCGYGCCGMRFVVGVDLVATCAMPASVLYVAYLVFATLYGATGTGTGDGVSFPLLSLVIVAAIYGVQVVVFVVRMRWAHVVWMVLYLLSLPLFAFVIPLYSFWHFDDFTWGSTRVVRGGGGGGGTAGAHPHVQSSSSSSKTPSLTTAAAPAFRTPHIPMQRYTELEYERDVGGAAGGGQSAGSRHGHGGSARGSGSASPDDDGASEFSRYPPSRTDLDAFIRHYLETHDLMRTTRKGTREAVKAEFGVWNVNGKADTTHTTSTTTTPPPTPHARWKHHVDTAIDAVLSELAPPPPPPPPETRRLESSSDASSSSSAARSERTRV
ncbi:chitin synthase-domain-containing protein [Powellomyces hirtus]|nr:chitin synthase-domain-containing protein [Powellomyces hirtus]